MSDKDSKSIDQSWRDVFFNGLEHQPLVEGRQYHIVGETIPVSLIRRCDYPPVGQAGCGWCWVEYENGEQRAVLLCELQENDFAWELASNPYDAETLRTEIRKAVEAADRAFSIVV